MEPSGTFRYDWRPLYLDVLILISRRNLGLAIIMERQQDESQSLAYTLGLVESKEFANQLLLVFLANQSDRPPETDDKKLARKTYSPDPDVYRRLAESQNELAKARTFIDSLNRSRAYRLMMRLLRLVGRVK